MKNFDLKVPLGEFMEQWIVQNRIILDAIIFRAKETTSPVSNFWKLMLLYF